MRKSQIIMGTGVTVDIPDGDARIFDEVFALFHQIDDRFSTYKVDSEVSRYGRGEITDELVSAELAEVLAACREAQASTGGKFSAWAAGDFDPSGYVKGWAIARAGEYIESRGYTTYCVSIGGDILARGKDWSIGIQDPRDRMAIVANIRLKDGAVATSGDYARGAHIINPKNKKAATQLASVSVVGEDIIQADVLATAAFVAGDKALEFMADRGPGYEVLVIDKGGRLESSPGFDKYLA